MTHDEMRRQLAWAQGWTEITTGSDGDLYGSPPGTADPDEWDTVPDPLESDRDAALLRAWCAEQWWCITCCHDEGWRGGESPTCAARVLGRRPWWTPTRSPITAAVNGLHYVGPCWQSSRPEAHPGVLCTD